jgi:hypothetical protein
MSPDFFNGLFEAVAGLLVFNNCRAVLRDKQVKGVSIISTAIFTSWGFFNIYYYPSLDQWWSFSGGLVIVSANSLWVYLMVRYTGGWPLLWFRTKMWFGGMHV